MATPRATRRRPEEIRRLLLEAAARVFAEKGFAAATAEEIAEEAGVARSAMYRHFRNKPDLLSHAVVQPFVEFLDEFDQVWQSQRTEPWDDERITRRIVEIFYDSCVSHRDALIGLVAAGDGLDPETLDDVRTTLDRMFARLVTMIQSEAVRRGWPVEPMTVEITMRLMFGTIGSITALDQLFLPAGRRAPSREQLVDHITKLWLYGSRLVPPGEPVS